MTCMNRRGPEIANPLDKIFAGIESVDRAQLRLQRVRLLELILVVWLIVDTRHADRGVRIDQPGRHISCV